MFALMKRIVQTGQNIWDWCTRTILNVSVIANHVVTHSQWWRTNFSQVMKMENIRERASKMSCCNPIPQIHHESKVNLQNYTVTCTIYSSCYICDRRGLIWAQSSGLHLLSQKICWEHRKTMKYPKVLVKLHTLQILVKINWTHHYHHPTNNHNFLHDGFKELFP